MRLPIATVGSEEPTLSLLRHISRGKGQALQKLLGGDVIVGGELADVGFQLSLEFLTGLLNLPVGHIAIGPILKQLFDSAARLLIGGLAQCGGPIDLASEGV